MRPQRIRFLLTFLAGMMVTVLVATISGSVASVAATRYEDLSLFTNVLNLVRRNYVEPVEDSVLVRGAVRGMLQELDPHSSFLDIDAYKEMQVDTRGEFHGLASSRWWRRSRARRRRRPASARTIRSSPSVRRSRPRTGRRSVGTPSR